jgi:hypothetical protein
VGSMIAMSTVFVETLRQVPGPFGATTPSPSISRPIRLMPVATAPALPQLAGSVPLLIEVTVSLVSGTGSPSLAQLPEREPSGATDDGSEASGDLQAEPRREKAAKTKVKGGRVALAGGRVKGAQYQKAGRSKAEPRRGPQAKRPFSGKQKRKGGRPR